MQTRMYKCCICAIFVYQVNLQHHLKSRTKNLFFSRIYIYIVSYTNYIMLFSQRSFCKPICFWYPQASQFFSNRCFCAAEMDWIWWVAQNFNALFDPGSNSDVSFVYNPLECVKCVNSQSTCQQWYQQEKNKTKKHQELLYKWFHCCSEMVIWFLHRAIPGHYNWVVNAIQEQE